VDWRNAGALGRRAHLRPPVARCTPTEHTGEDHAADGHEKDVSRTGQEQGKEAGTRDEASALPPRAPQDPGESVGLSLCPLA